MFRSINLLSALFANSEPGLLFEAPVTTEGWGHGGGDGSDS